MDSQTRNEWNRRAVMKTLGLGLGAACLGGPVVHAAPQRRLKIGQTSINWGFVPDSAEPGVRDSAKLGYWSYEAYGDAMDAVEQQIGWSKLMDKYNIPMTSAYFPLNLTDPAVRPQMLEKAVRLGNILKKCGGKTAIIGPNSVNRATYDFKAAKPVVAAMLNEVSKALDGMGLISALHQHTGTCVDSSDEVYAIMDAVDTRVVKFGPDVGQLQKGGADPVKILKDFLPLLRNIHLKDYVGGRAWAGYCPLGQGKVPIPAVMDVLEQAKDLHYVMVELDGTPNAPMAPFDCARTSKEYLMKLGYTFRS